jgi:hypothetical protein
MKLLSRTSDKKWNEPTMHILRYNNDSHRGKDEQELFSKRSEVYLTEYKLRVIIIIAQTIYWYHKLTLSRLLSKTLKINKNSKVSTLYAICCKSLIYEKGIVNICKYPKYRVHSLSRNSDRKSAVKDDMLNANRISYGMSKSHLLDIIPRQINLSNALHSASLTIFYLS